MLALLKFIGIVGTAIFGVFGSLTDFRDSRGRITKQGWIGLFGVLICAASVGAIQIYSDEKSEESAITLIKSNKRILDDINRSLYQLPGLTVSYFLRPDWKHPKLQSHFKKITQLFGALPASMAGTSTGTSFGGGSFPELLENREFEISVCGIRPVIFFFRNPIEPKNYRYKGLGESSTEDLRISLKNPCEDDLMGRTMNRLIKKVEDRVDKELGADKSKSAKWFPKGEHYSMEYRMENGNVLFFDMKVENMEVDSTSDAWYSNSVISSVFDLLGAQMIIQLTSSGGYEWNPELSPEERRARKEETDVLRRSASLSGLVLRIPNGIALGFDNDNLKEYVGELGMKYYSFNFPNNIEKLIEQTRYNRFKRCCRPIQ